MVPNTFGSLGQVGFGTSWGHHFLVLNVKCEIEKSRAIEILERFCARWKEHYYAPGGRFENIAARFEQQNTHI
jgi:hypothetical protein